MTLNCPWALDSLALGYACGHFLPPLLQPAKLRLFIIKFNQKFTFFWRIKTDTWREDAKRVAWGIPSNVF